MPRLDLLVADDCEAVNLIESEAFPADEAADLDGIKFRQRVAPEYFMKWIADDGTIIGYVNGTKCIGSEITHESMSEHKPEGETLILHSVTISAPYRKQGHATNMLRAYMDAMYEKKADLGITKTLLLCKQNLRHFYEDKVGFEMIRVSPVVHGQDTWYELGMDINKR